jgi:hypothetical protein
VAGKTFGTRWTDFRIRRRGEEVNAILWGLKFNAETRGTAGSRVRRSGFRVKAFTEP